MLEGAVACPAATLVQAVIDAPRKGGGKELALQAMFLTWALAHKPDVLAEVERFILSHPQARQDDLNLIIIVGRVGSDESRKCLLRWLDSPSFSEFERDILDSVNQSCFATEWEAEHEYWSMLHKDTAGWRTSLLQCGETSTDPAVVQATIRRTEASSPPALRQVAAGILMGLVDEPEKFQGMSADSQAAVIAAFRPLQRADDPALRRTALEFLAKIDAPGAISDTWTEYAQQTDLYSRMALAETLAGRASSLEDVRRILAAAQDAEVGVRSHFIGNLHTSFAQGAEDRAAVAREIATWAMAEANENLRERALDRLASLLPESAPSMQWGLTDPSEAVRTRASKALAPK